MSDAEFDTEFHTEFHTEFRTELQGVRRRVQRIAAGVLGQAPLTSRLSCALIFA